MAENERIVDIYRPNRNAKPDDPPSESPPELLTLNPEIRLLSIGLMLLSSALSHDCARLPLICGVGSYAGGFSDSADGLEGANREGEAATAVGLVRAQHDSDGEEEPRPAAGRVPRVDAGGQRWLSHRAHLRKMAAVSSPG